MHSIKTLALYALSVLALVQCNAPKDSSIPELPVVPVNDFELTADTSNATWDVAKWNILDNTLSPDSRKAKFKMAYSKTGMYFLFYSEDPLITATKKDNEHLWEEDAVEIFLYTDTRYPLYLEYELSPRDQELVLLIPRIDGTHLGWIPWEYTGNRKTRHRTNVTSKDWTAEVFIPYTLFAPLANVPPKKGMKWKANFYRVDHDLGKETEWSWQKTEKTFHETDKFGNIVFQ
jgi:hypothetical protein